MWCRPPEFLRGGGVQRKGWRCTIIGKLQHLACEEWSLFLCFVSKVKKINVLCVAVKKEDDIGLNIKEEDTRDETRGEKHSETDEEPDGASKENREKKGAKETENDDHGSKEVKTSGNKLPALVWLMPRRLNEG